MLQVSAATIFILGLIAGSFLNCVIYRLEEGKSFLKGRSFCPNCKHVLSWQDLFPVFSFLFLKGKCRYCQKSISWRYPLVEFCAAFLFLFGFWHSGSAFNLDFAIWAIISSFLIVVFVFDLKHYIIPDRVIYLATAIAFFYQLFVVWNFGHWDLFLIWSLGLGVLPSLFLLAIILISRGQWMGMGDFKLAIFMGLFLGFPNILLALFLAFFFGAVGGLILIILKKKTLRAEIPFGPFLVAGTMVSFFWGEEIIFWYQNLFYV